MFIYLFIIFLLIYLLFIYIAFELNFFFGFCLFLFQFRKCWNFWRVLNIFLVTHTDTHRLAVCIGHQLLLLLLLVCGQQTCIVCLKKKTGASACRTELLLTPNVVTSGDLTHRTNSAQPPRRAELKLSHRHRVVAMTIDDAAQRRGRR